MLKDVFVIQTQAEVSQGFYCFLADYLILALSDFILQQRRQACNFQEAVNVRLVGEVSQARAVTDPSIY